MGKMVFHVSAAFSELERGMIRERVNAGLDRARKQGKRLGRPPVPPIKVRKVLELREEKLPLRKIAKQAGISREGPSDNCRGVGEIVPCVESLLSTIDYH